MKSSVGFLLVWCRLMQALRQWQVMEQSLADGGRFRELGLDDQRFV